MNKPTLPVILIADDSADDRLLFEHLLRKAGIENPLVFADSGEAAIVALRRSCPAGGGRRRHKPEVVFLDVNMPSGGGFRVLQWIRKKPAFQRTRVVMLTDSSQPADLKRAEELKADAYLLKHPHPRTLAALIRAAIASQATAILGDSLARSR